MTKYGGAYTSESTPSSASTTQSMDDASLGSITCHKLNGRKFLPWSHSVLMFVCERGKKDIITGNVADYFSALTRLWQQMDLTESRDWKCNKDEKLYRSIVENKRVFKFLMGMNKCLDDVRSRILSTKPIPTVRDAFSEVRHEESL